MGYSGGLDREISYQRKGQTLQATDMIPLFYPQIYKEEWLEELSGVFSTRWIGQGPLVCLLYTSDAADE